MAGRIHFSSGKTLEITENEFRNMPPQLNAKGIKVQRLKVGHLIPMNSMTMEYIEYIPEDEVIVDAPVVSRKAPVVLTTSEEEPMAPAEPVIKKKTDEEVMADMMVKSNCKHEPEKLELYVQHTAKGVRYFPVCSFCGKRERYVSEKKILEGAYTGTPNEKWTEADLQNSKPWIEG